MQTDTLNQACGNTLKAILSFSCNSRINVDCRSNPYIDSGVRIVQNGFIGEGPFREYVLRIEKQFCPSRRKYYPEESRPFYELRARGCNYQEEMYGRDANSREAMLVRRNEAAKLLGITKPFKFDSRFKPTTILGKARKSICKKVSAMLFEVESKKEREELMSILDNISYECYKARKDKFVCNKKGKAFSQAIEKACEILEEAFHSM